MIRDEVRNFLGNTLFTEFLKFKALYASRNLKKSPKIFSESSTTPS